MAELIRLIKSNIVGLVLGSALMVPAQADPNITFSSHIASAESGADIGEYFLNGWRTGMLESAYRNHQGLRTSEIDIHVMDRHITLTGYVGSDAAKALAEEIALSIHGVDHVINDLDVLKIEGDISASTIADSEAVARSREISKILSDNNISTSVKTKLLNNRATRNSDVDIVVDGDTVTLTGSVITQTESDLIFYITHNTHGVSSVVNKLVVLSRS